jgi:hypothetical protein
MTSHMIHSNFVVASRPASCGHDPPKAPIPPLLNAGCRLLQLYNCLVRDLVPFTGRRWGRPRNQPFPPQASQTHDSPPRLLLRPLQLARSRPGSFFRRFGQGARLCDRRV